MIGEDKLSALCVVCCAEEDPIDFLPSFSFQVPYLV